MTAYSDVTYALGVLAAHGHTAGPQADDDGTPRWWVVTRGGRTIRGITSEALVELAHDEVARGGAAQPSLLEEGRP